ncbi:hypothetical protein FisN_1Hh525 [Fistulifera solaris]|uniref:Uncharacterized protein n=1 Tax=Fistulifera solaris TaxID=1519565 RepID=A0A1Z5JJY8_FISSO|nr:hypothetical protein FisN_1Hh525 [Fistulifera solaris]|eukprot:GAX14325.1 hypothetical protein FisN_1Hh525 [Fistulifera solaris]
MNWSSSLLLIFLAIAIGLISVLQFTATTIHDVKSHITASEAFQISIQEFMSPKPTTLDQKFIKAAHYAKEANDLLPDIQKQSHQASDKRPDYYMVFSSSCSPQQHWESFVFFYHAFKVGQPGNVTRILSGCNDQEKEEVDDFFAKYIRPMSPRFHLHHTQDYGKVQKNKKTQYYKYMNKPFGLQDWMENALGVSENKRMDSDLADSIVMLLDPDMVLLRPLVHDFTNEDVEFVEEEPATKVVKTGFPIAQQDGYLSSKWVQHDFSFVTAKEQGDFIPPPPAKEGPLHWNSGPPYLATVADMYRIAIKWTEYAPNVLEIQDDIFAEMVGLIIATVQLELPFTFIRSLVVSTTESVDREGWSYIDALPDDQVCRPAASARLPVGLHYCKRYMLGKVIR